MVNIESLTFIAANSIGLAIIRIQEHNRSFHLSSCFQLFTSLDTMSSLRFLIKRWTKYHSNRCFDSSIHRRLCLNQNGISIGMSVRRCSSTPRRPNYFQLLDLPERFDIDEESLRSNFQRGMMEYHPDKHATKSEEEQKEAEQISIELNTAKSTLESPLLRAQHLLSLIESDTLDDSYQIMDQSFLLDIMKIRSEIESTTESDALQQLLDDNAVTMEGLTSEIANAFESDNDEKVENIKELLAKLTYYHKIEGEIKDKMPARDLW